MLIKSWIRDRKRAKRAWHTWFAWKPVWLGDMEVYAFGQFVFRIVDSGGYDDKDIYRYCGDPQSSLGKAITDRNKPEDRK